MGESVTEATVIAWLVQEGEQVREDEPLLEVATDKVDTEVHASSSGILKEILVPEGQVAHIGKPIALILSGEEVSPVFQSPESQKEITNHTAGSPNGEETANVHPSNGVKQIAEIADLPADGVQASRNPVLSDKFYSPLVRKIAQEQHLGLNELDSIPGTGAGGRLTADDLVGYLKKRVPEGVPQPAESEAITLDLHQDDQVIEMDRVRKIIAERMKASIQLAAHVYSFLEADVTGIISWKNRMAKYYLEHHGVRLTYSPVFIEAIARALRDFPMLNSSVEGTRVVLRGHINIGMAVALPNGNLIVPVIKDADQLNLAQLAQKVNDLALRARENKLSLEEITGATYTMTNVGQFGTTYNTPIIMQPNVGILAFGTIEKKPVVLETPEHGDIIAIRQRMVLSHAYDHRVIDGALGSMFVKRVREYLENFDTSRQE